MDEQQARQRIAQLRAEIGKNNDLYYNQDAPELEDYEYDQLTQELRALEQQFPQLVTKDSPTQRIDAVASAVFTKVPHAVRMESLQDVFSLKMLKTLCSGYTNSSPKPSLWWNPKLMAFRSAWNTVTGCLCAALPVVTAMWAKM